MISRRAMLASLGGVGALGAALGLSAASESDAPQASGALKFVIDDVGAGAPINPFLYGANETGTMGDLPPSVSFDAAAGVVARRLGGNFMTSYNWRNNANNAGKDWKHENGAFLLSILGIDRADWDRPAAVIDKFLANSREVGAASFVTLPLAGFVSADRDGAVSPAEAAPSRRFAPVDWSDGHVAGAVSIPALLAHVVRAHGGAKSGGPRGYYLDNEPGLWSDTHPRIVPQQPTIRSLIERSLRAAKAIKTADPDALVLGPASWGSTEFQDFVKAPDWADYRDHGSFLGAYLDAFRLESERAGRRLLDALDVHWYPFNRSGVLFQTENAGLAQALLDAPRSLDEPGFCENSWVAESMGCKPGPGLHLPLLPSLQALIGERFPGVALTLGEYNYGGPGLLATGLAVADALGRFGRNGVAMSNHWGPLQGFIGEAFRLYRMRDAGGDAFGATALPVSSPARADVRVFAARADKGALTIVVLNKTVRAATLEISTVSGRARAMADTLGFDEVHPQCASRRESENGIDASGVLRLSAPPLSARRYRLA